MKQGQVYLLRTADALALIEFTCKLRLEHALPRPLNVATEKAIMNELPCKKCGTIVPTEHINQG